MAGEFGLHDAPFVMPLFRPGIGKEQQYLGQRPGRQMVAQQLHRIGPQNAYIAVLLRCQLQHQVADPGTVHLDAQVVALGMAQGRFGQGLTVAEADLQGDRIGIAEQARQVQASLRQLQTVNRPEFIESPLLGIGDAPLAQHIAADGVLRLVDADL